MQTYDETKLSVALARAVRDGIRVVADFGSHWYTNASAGATLYRVTEDEQGLHCQCKANPAKCICKHIAVVAQRLNEQQQEREQAQAEALAELASRDAAASLAAQMEQYHATVRAWNDAALAETEASLAAHEQAPALLAGLLLYGAVQGQAKAAAKEAQWQRYQDARASGGLR